MKKIFTILLCAFAVTVNSQSLSTSGVVTTTVTGLDTDPVMSLTFDVVNNSANTIVVKVNKTELTSINGTDNSFCWGGQCFDPTTIISPNSVTLAPGAMTNAVDKFIGDYYPNGIAGTVIVRYCFYDENNVNDQTCIDITYDATTTGVSDINKASSYLSGSTFISRNRLNTFNYKLVDAKNATVNMVNMLGVTVKSFAINSNQGILLMNAGDLKSGVYFLSLVVNGNAVSGKKVVVE